jgi:transposase
MRLGHDMLATASRLAGRRRVGSTAPGPARRAGASRPNRLVASRARFIQRPSKGGGQETGPNPTDRGKPGTKQHLIVDAAGIPLAVDITAANVNECNHLQPMLDKIRPIHGRRGRPRFRPDKLHADKAYDHVFCRAGCQIRGVIPRIARRGIESAERLGRHRWVVERSFAWLHTFRRLATRYERRADIHRAFLHLGAALICFNSVARLFC